MTGLEIVLAVALAVGSMLWFVTREKKQVAASPRTHFLTDQQKTFHHASVGSIWVLYRSAKQKTPALLIRLGRVPQDLQDALSKGTLLEYDDSLAEHRRSMRRAWVKYLMKKYDNPQYDATQAEQIVDDVCRLWHDEEREDVFKSVVQGMTREQDSQKTLMFMEAVHHGPKGNGKKLDLQKSPSAIFELDISGIGGIR